jgi:glycogen phosphorylase
MHELNRAAQATAAPASADAAALLKSYAISAALFSGSPDALYERHLKYDNIVEPETANTRERYKAAARAVRDILSDRWLRTHKTYARENPKRIYYISIEFLIGRSLGNNVMNLLLDPIVGPSFKGDSGEWWEILHEEPDAGLGNGGLGRLAACFLDSMATMQLPAMGYGLRYEHGIFRQKIQNGWQEERSDNWLANPDPWEIVRPAESVPVTFGCSFELREGKLRMIPNKPSTLIGVPYDRPVVGYGGKTVNTLRLWSATAAQSFNFQEFSGGDFVAAIAEGLNAESLTRVLYPDDHTQQGRALRLTQEYFLVACSLADAIRRFQESNSDWRLLPEKAAIQLNDTHPTLAVPELMRILLDEAHLGWDEAWDITRATLAYTNHTLLPEALERWPVDWMRLLIPRQLEIIFEINRRLLDDIHARYPDDAGRTARVSLVEEGQTQHVRMAHVAIVGSHSTNGVAAIHSELLRRTTVKDLAEVFPERFNNKTNGVTPRRWLKLANPSLATAISGAIGDGWITDLAELQKLRPLAKDAAFLGSVQKAQHECKARFADGSRGTRTSPSIRTQFLIARSSAFTSTSASCSMLCASSFSTSVCVRIRASISPLARSSSPARRRRPIILRKSSSNSSTIWLRRSTPILRCAANSRLCSCRNTMSRSLSAAFPPPMSRTRFRLPATRRAAPAI